MINLKEVLEKYVERQDEKDEVLAATDVYASKFLAQLDSLQQTLKDNPQISSWIDFEIKELQVTDEVWSRRVRIEGSMIQFFYVREVGSHTNALQSVRCARLMAHEWKLPEAPDSQAVPILVIDLFKDCWIAYIDPFMKSSPKISGKDSDFSTVILRLITAVLLETCPHWPPARSVDRILVDALKRDLERGKKIGFVQGRD